MFPIVNGTVIYEEPDPLPNDNSKGPGGEGNWGTASLDIPPGVLKEDENTLSITNLDPSDKINYPIFVMLDYAVVSWGQ